MSHLQSLLWLTGDDSHCYLVFCIRSILVARIHLLSGTQRLDEQLQDDPMYGEQRVGDNEYGVCMYNLAKERPVSSLGLFGDFLPAKFDIVSCQSGS